MTTRTGETLPLDQYAALGDGRSVALVGSDGSIDWWCVPNMDSAAFFDRILDPEDGGRFAITPEEAFTVERHYREDSNVLEHIFATASGTARVTDSLNSGISGRLPWSELARRIEGLTGCVVFAIEVRPGKRLDEASAWREPNSHGDVLHVDGIIAALRTDEHVERIADDDRRMLARHTTSPGSHTLIALLASADEPLILPTLKTIDQRIDRTDKAWREWSENLIVDGPYASQVRRSALALKLLLFSPSGAIAAAATTSLPERIGGDKNYDYRFAWIRDVAYTIKAFLRVGAVEEAKAAFSWLTTTVRRHEGGPRVMYSLDGSLAPQQEELDLPGFAGSTPVLQGNKARSQLQLGIYGDILETAALFVDEGHVLDLITRRLLAHLADRCADLWHKKDTGIWELEDEQHYTMSKMSCWTALDRAVDLARHGQIESSHPQRWERERKRIVAWIDTHCWSDVKGAYTLYAGTEKLDAAHLLAVRFGFGEKERMISTRAAIQRDLSRGPLVYRYSGMEAEEGTFTACGFWMVEAYALLGDRAAAIRQMDEMLVATGNNLGLLTEQVDAGSGAMLGNTPQALSHLALIHAATAIEESCT